MLKLRMRTKFLLSMLLISAGLTCTSLLLVRHSVQKQVRREIFADLRNSVSTFQNFQRERELTLMHSAELMADLPPSTQVAWSLHDPRQSRVSCDHLTVDHKTDALHHDNVSGGVYPASLDMDLSKAVMRDA